MHKTIDLVSEKGSLLKYGQKRKVLLVNVHSRVNMDEKIRFKSQFLTVMELSEHLMFDSDDNRVSNHACTHFHDSQQSRNQHMTNLVGLFRN